MRHSGGAPPLLLHRLLHLCSSFRQIANIQWRRCLRNALLNLKPLKFPHLVTIVRIFRERTRATSLWYLCFVHKAWFSFDKWVIITHEQVSASSKVFVELIHESNSIIPAFP